MAACSLRNVAQRVGVSATAAYRHFANKEEMLAEVAAYGLTGLEEALRVADRRETDPLEALVAQGVAYVRYALSHPGIYRLMFGTERLNRYEVLDQAGQGTFQVLQRRIAEICRPDVQIEDAILGCWSLVHGLASLHLDREVHLRLPDAGQDEASLGAVVRAMVSSLLPR